MAHSVTVEVIVGETGLVVGSSGGSLAPADHHHPDYKISVTGSPVANATKVLQACIYETIFKTTCSHKQELLNYLYLGSTAKIIYNKKRKQVGLKIASIYRPVKPL